jgi:NADPH-dependent 2,4-dienoyl-CoA reductase/sulfur reductase-like enzyme
MSKYDIAVIGAGPAGMAAAAQAAALGAKTLLLDEQDGPGGQIYRHIEHTTPEQLRVLGKSYEAGQKVLRDLCEAPVEHIRRAAVWMVGKDGEIAWSVDGKASITNAKRIITATGALERPVPIPGWTLPGVMTAGAAQILLKQSGLVPQRAVLAGAGPLLYLLASQLIAAGAPPLAIVETNSMRDVLAAAMHLKPNATTASYLKQGMKMLAAIRKAGVPRYRAAQNLRVEGECTAEAITFSCGVRTHRFECDYVLLHQGVVPNTQIIRSLGLDHRWDEQQRCFRPVIDRWGQACETVYVAGDGGGIGGAKAAELQGRMAALHAVAGLGIVSNIKRDDVATPLKRELAAELPIRAFLDRAYAPSEQVLAPHDDTIICRCEEITAGNIRSYAKLGCTGPNQAKAFGRCGMGPCQGRYCGLTVSELLAAANGQTHDQTGYFRIRPPLKPITIGELAALESE